MANCSPYCLCKLVWQCKRSESVHRIVDLLYSIYWEMFIRLISFVTTSMTLSRIRQMVLNEERMIEELLEIRSQLAKYTADGEEKTGPGV